MNENAGSWWNITGVEDEDCADHMWYSNWNYGYQWHPHWRAPRCLLCNSDIDVSGLRMKMVKACPCTPKKMCDLEDGYENVLDSRQCGIPRQVLLYSHRQFPWYRQILAHEHEPYCVFKCKGSRCNSSSKTLVARLLLQTSFTRSAFLWIQFQAQVWIGHYHLAMLKTANWRYKHPSSKLVAWFYIFERDRNHSKRIWCPWLSQSARR